MIYRIKSFIIIYVIDLEEKALFMLHVKPNLDTDWLMNSLKKWKQRNFNEKMCQRNFQAENMLRMWDPVKIDS